MIYTQLRAFNAVAVEGSFSKAAAALGITQPALTIQVKALEEAYGVRLFDRKGRSIRLTAVGQHLFRLSRRLAGIEEHVRDLLAGSAELRQGTLRLAADGPHIVMGLFAHFMARYPGVRLSVAMGNTEFVRRQLLDRQVDCAILPAIGGHRQVHAIRLWEHRAVVIVAPNHPWAGRGSIAIGELDGQPMLTRERGSMTERILRAALQAAHVRPRFVLQLGSREAVCEAAAAGIGIGVIWELEARGSTRFRALAIHNADIRSTDYVACLKSEQGRQAIRAFFAVAAIFSPLLKETIPASSPDRTPVSRLPHRPAALR